MSACLSVKSVQTQRDSSLPIVTARDMDEVLTEGHRCHGRTRIDSNQRSSDDMAVSFGSTVQRYGEDWRYRLRSGRCLIITPDVETKTSRAGQIWTVQLREVMFQE